MSKKIHVLIYFSGTGQLITVELVSISGGEDQPELGELCDITADHYVRFNPTNPHSTLQKMVVVKNNAWATCAHLRQHRIVCTADTYSCVCISFFHLCVDTWSSRTTGRSWNPTFNVCCLERLQTPPAFSIILIQTMCSALLQSWASSALQKNMSSCSHTVQRMYVHSHIQHKLTTNLTMDMHIKTNTNY